MERHGKFELRTVDKIVHTYPREGFNVEGIEQYLFAVRKTAETFEQWVLYEHPHQDAALTPDSLERLVSGYEELRLLGCIGVAVEITSLFKDILNDKAPQVYSGPFLASDDTAELERFLSDVLKNTMA